MIYRIRDWDKNFENDRSRKVERCSYLVAPNKQHGVGFTYIMAEQDGASIFGLFKLMAGAVSMQQRVPRGGWLTDDGTEAGRPWTVEDMALRWRRKPDEVARAIEVLSSSRVNWLQAYSRPGHVELTPDSRPTPVQLTSNSRPTPMEGRKEGREGKKELTASSETANGSGSEPTPAVLTFETIGREQTWALTQAQVDEWRALYPGLDILAECRKALAWTKAKQRKTAKGMPGFLVRWFSRAIDSPCRRQDAAFVQHRRRDASSFADVGPDGEVPV